MESTKRRLSCPQTVQIIWDTIAAIRHGKQQSSLERILCLMKKKHGLDDEYSMRQVKMAVTDDLICTIRKVGSKGSQQGVKQTIYNLPNKGIKRDGHDWYCFTCQKGGSVLSCKTCFRVYHAVCCNREDMLKPTAVEKLVCPICMVLKSPSTLKIRKDDLNTLLGFTCNRLKEKPFRELTREPPSLENAWREKALIYNYVDLAVLEDKARQKKYRRLEEFEADVQNIVHNVVIYYGVNSPVADMARQMLRDCSYDLREIRQCQDCYRMSNEKRDRFWFCQPCDPPHELVYAKQKGYPYWPAKVIRRMNSGNYFDVRFFGGPHERATVEKTSIKPITTSPSNLGVKKRSTSWTRACDELKKHQEMIAKHSKIRPIIQSVKVEVSMDDEEEGEEKEESEDEPRPQRIDRYVRSIVAKSSPKQPDQCEEWSPIRRSERSRIKKLPYDSKSGIAKKGASSAEKYSSKSVEAHSPKGSAIESPVSQARKRCMTPSSMPILQARTREDSTSLNNGSRRTNPRRTVNIKPGTLSFINNESSDTGDETIEMRRPRSTISRFCRTSANGLPENARQGSSSMTSSAKTLVNTQTPQSSRTNCTVKANRVVAGPSDNTESDEPQAKRRVLWPSDTANRTPVECATASHARGNASLPALPVTSTTKPDGQCRTPTPDDLNVVSSSSQSDTVVSQVSVGTQTGQLNSFSSKSIQTDPEPPSGITAVSKSVTQATDDLKKTLQANLKREHEIALETVQNEFQAKLLEKETMIRSNAGDQTRKEIERVKLEIETNLKQCHDQETKELSEKHQRMISEVKKKQWCYNCESEAIYHCCWNTSYCSTECQQNHWQKEHKRTCRRKR